jgi:hypothetical protein
VSTPPGSFSPAASRVRRSEIWRGGSALSPGFVLGGGEITFRGHFGRCAAVG